MLRIYVSVHCPTCASALHLAERVQSQRPEVPLEVVDVDAPGADVPSKVIGTPIYAWHDRILFLGNPSETELLERIGVLHARER
jgi:hypothetical protein